MSVPRLLPLPALIVLAGCGTAGGTLQPSEAPTPTPAPEEPTVVEETLDFASVEAGADLFPADGFVAIRIELPAASWDALVAAPYEWAVADVVIDGRRFEDVAVRLRGRIGSFREVSGKPKWRLDFNRYVPGRRIDGLESLSLDNNVVDCSGLKQMLGAHVLHLADVPTSRVGFARVWVNDAPYGLYNTVEVQDDRFLVRRWEDPGGNLYDGAYIWYGGWNYTLLDFLESVDLGYELEEGTDVGHADIRAVTEALAAALGQADFAAAMDDVWDWEAFYPYAAAEHWIGQNDGYVLNINNYRVYFDPEDGRAELISYDLDYAFMDAPWGDSSFSNPRGLIAWGCLTEEACRARVADAVADLLDLLEGEDLSGALQGWDDLTWFDAVSDPKMPCAEADIWPSRNRLYGWAASRGPQLRQYWGIE